MIEESSHTNDQILFFGLPTSDNLLLKSTLESSGIEVTFLHSNGQSMGDLECLHPDMILYDPAWEVATHIHWRNEMQLLASQLGIPFLPFEKQRKNETFLEDPGFYEAIYHTDRIQNIKFQLVRSREQKRIVKLQDALADGALSLEAKGGQSRANLIFFDQLFTNSSISTVVFDTEGWALRVNTRFIELFGIAKEHFEGKKYNLFRDEAIIRYGYVDGLKKIFEERKKGEWDIIYDLGLSADSQNLPIDQRVVKIFRTWAFPICDATGDLQYVVIQQLDISENKNKDSTIQLHEQILNNLAEGVSLTRSADNRIVFTNPTFDRIFGYAPGELLDKHVSCLNGSLDVEDQEMANKIIDSLMEHGFWNGELLNVRKDGSLFWSMANVTTFDHPEFGKVWVTVQQDITNRIEAEKALRKAEFENRTVLNTFPYLMFRIDKYGKIFDYRAPDESLLYTGPEFFLGKLLKEVLPRDLGMKLHYKVREAIQQMKVVNVEYMLNIQGQDKYFEGSVIPISMAEVLLFVHDESKAKIAEEAIRISEERYNLVIQTTKDGVWDWDILNDISYVSPRWCELMGSPQDVNLLKHPFKNWLKRIHVDYRNVVEATFKVHLEKGNPFEVDYLFEVQPGQFYWRRTVGQVVTYMRGEPVRMVGLTIDIDERKRVELQLEQSIKEVSDYKKALDQAAIVSIADTVGTILYVNKKFCEQYSYTQEEVIGRNHNILNSGVHPKEFWQQFWSEICQGKVFKAEVCNRGKNGELHWSDTTIVPFLDEEGIPYQFLAIRNDITQKRKLEKELAEQQLLQQKIITEVALLEQEKERNELGRELHDNINQILATAKIYLGMARSKDGDVDSLLTHSFTHLNSAIEEIRRLSHNLVAPSLGDIGLHAALQTLLSDAENTDLFHIRFEDEVKDFSILGKKGELMLYRIIQEQLNNIRKHAKAKQVVIRLEVENVLLHLSIIDDGVGFDGSKKSSGIGLSNIQNRVTFYSGTMHYEASPGKGFALHIFIPFAASKNKVI